MSVKVEKNPIAELPVINRIGILVVLICCGAIGFSIVEWSKKPEYRPLLNNIQVKESAKAVDILELNDIDYIVDLPNGNLYVEKSKSIDARIKLVNAGFDLEYPRAVDGENIQVTISDTDCRNPGEWWKDQWVMDYVRQGIGFFLLMMLFFGVLRPIALRIVTVKSEK